MVIFFGALLFTIRGYQISNNTLFVQRLGWRNSVDLSNLRKLEAKPNAMAGSIPTWCNGGLFSFSGKFKNKKLGSYQAFVTDNKNAVVMQFTDKTIVVSPGTPDEFVAIIKNIKNL